MITQQSPERKRRRGLVHPVACAPGSESGYGLCYNLRCVPHFLQFLHDAVNAAGADQKHPLRQPANDVLGQFLVGQQLLGQHGVLGLNQRYPAMQLDRDAGFFMKFTAPTPRARSLALGLGGLGWIRNKNYTAAFSVFLLERAGMKPACPTSPLSRML